MAIRELATALVTDPVYQASLHERLANGKAPHMETLLHYYAYGKPKEQVEHSGVIRMPRDVIFELHGL